LVTGVQMNAENAAKAKIDIQDLKLVSSNSNLHKLCIPMGLPANLMEKLDELVYARKRIKAGTTLYHAGSHFHSIYAVKTGFIKMATLHEDGREQITGFYMTGEILGFDGIATDEHMCTTVALEDSEVCAIPFDRLEHAGHELEDIQHHVYKLMSREIVRDHTIMMLLGSMQGEERVAAFLLNLSQRLSERGYSPSNLVLRMKREEIGSYLGMKVESVSRAFTKFRELGLLEVHQKHIRILDMNELQKLIGQHPCK
jgi:CRP/FNR family transcriptional regulator